MPSPRDNTCTGKSARRPPLEGHDDEYWRPTGCARRCEGSAAQGSTPLPETLGPGLIALATRSSLKRCLMAPQVTGKTALVHLRSSAPINPQPAGAFSGAHGDPIARWKSSFPDCRAADQPRCCPRDRHHRWIVPVPEDIATRHPTKPRSNASQCWPFIEGHDAVLDLRDHAGARSPSNCRPAPPKLPITSLATIVQERRITLE